MSFRLIVLSPKGVSLESEADELYVSTVNGPLGILPGYTRGVFKLAPSGMMKAIKNNRASFYAVFGGVLTIEGNDITIMSEVVDSAESIDIARANRAKERAERTIEESTNKVEVTKAKAALNRALTRLSVKSHGQGNE